MSTDNPNPPQARFPLLQNWLSLAGLVVVVGSIFSFLLLLLFDFMARSSNPYIGLLTYVVAPGFFFFGSFVAVIGLLRQRKKLRRTAPLLSAVQIDLSRARDRRVFGWFIIATILFLLVSATGSYHTYHYTESVQFCGQACHTVMKPELVTYQNGPHARVACVECHIGKGATWFVRSKLSGTYQLYATASDKYPKPVPTPIKNLRPAQDTCEECHWPKKFVGKLERTFHYFLSDETNTPYTVSLLMNVGGGDPTHGPVGGIHWHMNVGKKVEYIAAKKEKDVWVRDETRQSIPWVRIVDEQGVVTEYVVKGFTNHIGPDAIRRMDCMDCHNRPAHKYQTPDDAVALAMSLNHIDASLPWVKSNIVYSLTRNYTNESEALQGIATYLAEKYPDKPAIRPAITAVQKIYQDNFFPEMKASWKNYPDNIGHKNWPGCFRCHDGKHLAADGKRSISANDCNSCHTILTQGTGEDLLKMTPAGQAFKHPGGPMDNGCNVCHFGDF